MDRWEEEEEDERQKGSREAKALPLSTSAVALPQCSSFLGRHSGMGGKGNQEAHRGVLDAQLGVNSSSSAQERSFPELCLLQSLHLDTGA